MGIQQLEIYGYRSFKEVTWRPGQLNLVVGPNGSGKSNLLQMLELVSKAAHGNLSPFIMATDGIVPLLWDNQARKLGWKLTIDPVDKGRDQEKDALTFQLELAQIRRGSAYEISLDSLGNWYGFNRKVEPSPYWIFKRDLRSAFLYDQQQQKLVKLADDAFEDNESLLSQITDVHNRIPTITKRILSEWGVFQTIRTDRDAPIRKPVPAQRKARLDEEGRNLVSVLHTLYTGKKEFRQLIDTGMSAGFGDEYERLEFQPAAAQQIQLAVQWKSSTEPHAGQQLSDGTLRFLFLLTLLSHPEPPALIAIDEPETGLHPSMLPIIAEYAAEAVQRTQVVITTHSPEFLDCFTDYSPHVTLCHWEDGQTQLYSLDEGTQQNWLQKYRLGRLFTSGELDVLVRPKVDSPENLKKRFKDLPSLDEAMTQMLEES